MKIMNNNTYGWKHLFLISYFKHNTTLYAHTHKHALAHAHTHEFE